jgi:hypothetical protein
VIRTEHLLTLSLNIGSTYLLGAVNGGNRRIVSVPDGSFEGTRLNGIVEPGGVDWVLDKPDGSLNIDVRLVLRTDDSELIALRYTGIRHGPPEVLERVARGEPVDPADYYFRISPQFETGSTRYAWLNNIVAVGRGFRRPAGPTYEIFEVL